MSLKSFFAIILAVPTIMAAPTAEAKVAGREVLACACANAAGETKIDGYCPYIAGSNVEVDGQDYVSYFWSDLLNWGANNLIYSASLPLHGRSTWRLASQMISAPATTLGTPRVFARLFQFARLLVTTRKFAKLAIMKMLWRAFQSNGVGTYSTSLYKLCILNGHIWLLDWLPLLLMP